MHGKSFSVDSQEVFCPSHLQFPTFSSTIVHLLLSAAWLSYPDLLYPLKDTEAAAALVLEEIMELESTRAMSERQQVIKSGEKKQPQHKNGAAIQSMGNSAPVSSFSPAPGPRANVLHYRRVGRGKSLPDNEVILVKVIP